MNFKGCKRLTFKVLMFLWMAGSVAICLHNVSLGETNEGGEKTLAELFTYQKKDGSVDNSFLVAILGSKNGGESIFYASGNNR